MKEINRFFLYLYNRKAIAIISNLLKNAIIINNLAFDIKNKKRISVKSRYDK